MLRNDQAPVDLTLTVAITSGAKRDKLQLLVDGVAVGAPVTIAAQGDQNVPIVWAAPRPERFMKLTARLTPYANPGNAYTSPEAPAAVDLHYAGSPDILPPPAGISEEVINGLTASWFSATRTQVEGLIGAYGGSDDMSYPAAGDVFIMFINGVEQTRSVTAAEASSQRRVVVAWTQAWLTAASIAAAPAKRLNLQYKILDRAGNLSPLSADFFITSFLAEDPGVLAPPTADEQENDGAIIDAEARLGVHVNIPANAKVLQGQYVAVVWNGKELGKVLVAATNTAFPITVSALDVFPPGGPGSGTFDITYRLYSNDQTTFLGESGPYQVIVNLDAGGGEPDPDPETPWNERLQKAIINGDSSAELDNVITDADKVTTTTGATVIVPWFNTDTPTAADAFKAGDIITIWLGNNATATVINVQPSDVSLKADLTAKVSPADLAAFALSPSVPLKYVVERKLTLPPGASNFATSPDQTVTVKSADALPGGGTLNPPKLTPVAFFDDVYGEWVIGINEITAGNGTDVVFEHYKNKAEGDIIEIRFSSRDDYDAPPSDPVVVGSDTAIPPYPVPLGEVNGSSTLHIPAANLLALNAAQYGGYGTGYVLFSITNAAGTTPGQPGNDQPVVRMAIDTRPG
ncbi:hypothetical protein [Luteibacter rhizovicinus]|nr:hypothetical protein [Luteibacter rhizovicinus]